MVSGNFVGGFLCSKTGTKAATQTPAIARQISQKLCESWLEGHISFLSPMNLNIAPKIWGIFRKVSAADFSLLPRLLVIIQLCNKTFIYHIWDFVAFHHSDAIVKDKFYLVQICIPF